MIAANNTTQYIIDVNWSIKQSPSKRMMTVRFYIFAVRNENYIDTLMDNVIFTASATFYFVKNC